MKCLLRRNAGFSLIELLVVVAILAATAGMVVSMTGRLDAQIRYQTTAERLSAIRSAILGPGADGNVAATLSGGFLQDVGRLPESPQELLSRPAEVPAWHYDATWRTWAGWRGPYLQAPPMRQTGGTAIYDDYGNDFYGWQTAATANARLSGDVAIRSKGVDGTADDAGGGNDVYQKDYPDDTRPLISENEWVTDLQGLQVEVVNLTDTDYAASPVTVRFRILVPRWEQVGDALGAWDYPDDDDYVGRSFQLDVKPVNDPAGGNCKVYDFEAVGQSIRIPHGCRMLFLVQDANGQPLPHVNACLQLHLTRRVSPPGCLTLYLREAGS